MLEAGIALALLVALGAGGAAFVAAPDALLVGGAWLSAAGLAFGLPTGLVYHLALREALLAAGALPARWWLRPTALHDAIPAASRRRVLAWCGAGAAGFLVTVLGCALLALAAFRVASD